MRRCYRAKATWDSVSQLDFFTSQSIFFLFPPLQPLLAASLSAFLLNFFLFLCLFIFPSFSHCCITAVLKNNQKTQKKKESRTKGVRQPLSLGDPPRSSAVYLQPSIILSFRKGKGAKMLDTIHPTILEGGGKSLYFTLSKLTPEEVFSIWDTVSEFVIKQLSMNKGVSIPGLGTFSFTRQKLEMGPCKNILVQRPVFLLSEKLVQVHALKRNKIHTPGNIPVVPLNFIKLSLEGPFSRETVEGCVQETILFFSRSIADKKNVEFIFRGIGVLIIQDNRVKMKFYKDFLQVMDGSGNLLKGLSNRPGTSNSVLSSREASVPPSRTVVAFPRKEMEMETIMEEGEKPIKEERSATENKKKENLSPKRLLSRQTISPAKVTGVSIYDELEKNIAKMLPPRPTPVSDSKPEQKARPAHVPASRSRTSFLLGQNDGRTGQETCYPCMPHTPRSISVYLNEEKSRKDKEEERIPAQYQVRKDEVAQEMCSLCMKRAQRNIPFYLNEERRWKEKEEERILAKYQAQKDEEALRKEQLRASAKREQNKKVAAFNLEIAKTLRSQKKEKSPDTDKSYIFEKRPSSATPHQKHEAYAKELIKQLEEKAVRQTKLKLDQAVADRLEQVQLAEELVAQRTKYLKDRMAETQWYKKVLDTQIKMKPTPVPHSELYPMESIFGKNDIKKEKIEEKRRRSEEHSRHQQLSAANKKRAAVLGHLIDQRKEAEMIQRARKQ